MRYVDEGILGMSLHPNSPSIIHDAIEQKLFDEPIFTTYMQKCPADTHTCRDGGRITLGGKVSLFVGHNQSLLTELNTNF